MRHYDDELPRTGDKVTLWGVDYWVVAHLANESPVESGVVHVHLILKARGTAPTDTTPGADPQG